MKYPNRVNAYRLIKDGDQCHTELNGGWVPARALGFASVRSRVRCAWMVFTGKADALVWPGQ